MHLSRVMHNAWAVSLLFEENHNYLCHIDYNAADTGHERFQRPGRYGTHCPGMHNSVVHPGNLKLIYNVYMSSRLKCRYKHRNNFLWVSI